MSKSTSIYFLLALLFGIALWTILAIGTAVGHAPADIAGTWTFPTSGNLRIEQSGRTIEAFFPGHHEGMALAVQTVSAGRTHLAFGNATWTLLAIGQPGADDWHFDLSGKS